MNDISLVIGIIGIAIMAIIVIVWTVWTFRMIKNKKSGNRLVISADEKISVNINVVGQSGGGGVKPESEYCDCGGHGGATPISESIKKCPNCGKKKKPKRLPLAATGIGTGGSGDPPEFQKKPEITPLNEKKRKVEVRILNQKERFLIAKTTAVN